MMITSLIAFKIEWNLVDVLTLILSLIAIMVSVITHIREQNNTQRINAINLDAEFYRKIFFNSLINQIPAQRIKIKLSNNRVSKVDGLSKELNDLRKRCAFFKFKNAEFYNPLVNKLQDLEDKLVLLPNEDRIDENKFRKIEMELDKNIREIYEFIMKSYNGL